MDAELERFKTDISLADLAQAEYGYTKDKTKSSKNSLVLRLGSDTVVITRGEDGHDVYFSRGDESDCGSIIDFVKNRLGDNNSKLVRVRQALRLWCPGSKSPAAKRPARPPERPVAVPKDIAQVRDKAAALAPYSGQYLTLERKLDPDVINAFKVCQDEHGNACFLHRSADGIIGWEAKNKGFTGFSTGGLRGLFMGRMDSQIEPAKVKRIVVTEAAIDAMSYAQLRHKAATLYISTAGTKLSDLQQTSIKQVLAAASSALIVLAMDNDQAGHEMAERIQSMEPSRTMVRELPQCNDWNDDLIAGALRCIQFAVDAS